MPGRHHPGGPVQHRTEIVAVALLGLTGGDTHPHPQRHGRRPRPHPQRPLGVDRGVDRRRGPGERHRQPVPPSRKHIPVVGVHRGPHHLVMSRQRQPHPGRVRLPQPRRTLDIGEQKRHRPRRPLPHELPPAHPPTIPHPRSRRRPGWPRRQEHHEKSQTVGSPGLSTSLAVEP